MALQYLRHAVWIVSLSWLVTANTLLAAPLRNHPVTLSQPNGLVLNLYVSGDEYFNWIHDREGYTIIQDPQTGYYTYATLDAGLPVPSGFIVGQVDPSAVGIPKRVMPAKERMQQLRAVFSRASSVQGEEIAHAPSKGTINNLVVFIRFSDENEFNRQSSYYDTMFNSSASGQNSMRNYYREVSYDQLTINSTFYPAPSEGYIISYQDSEPRGYYQPFSVTNPIGYTEDNDGTDGKKREHALLVRAINDIAAQVPSSLNIDDDGDGNVDNVCFIIRGNRGGWNAILWDHAGKLPTQSVSIEGKQVLGYSFHLETLLDPGVLCHEMFHNIGAPDLFHYSFDGLSPAYEWDIMQTDLNPPQHMTAYMKYRYGKWITSIPAISNSGTYTLNPLTSATNNVYRINSPYSSTEYFLVEYRKQSTIFEKSLPGEGLIVYRINTTQDAKGNRDGPPDELYIFRPNGTPTANGDPSHAHFNADEGRIKIDDSTNPYSFLSSGFAGGLKISDIGAIGDTISFTLEGAGTVSAQVTRLTAVSNAAAGSTIQLRAEVKNTGTRPLPPDTAVWFYVQAPGLGVGNNWVGWYPVGGISPGYINWYVANWKIPKSVYGSAKYWARVYDGSTIFSEWSAEQEFAIKAPDPIGSATLSDLTVVNPVLGSIASFYARITNTGSASFSSDVQVWFYLEAPGLSEHWICYFGGLSYINPKGSNLGSAGWLIPGNVSPGLAKFWAIAYQGGTAISAWAGPKEFTISSGPKIYSNITSLWPVNDAVAGNTVKLWAQVQNTGSVALSSGTYLQFYIPEISDTMLGYAQSAGLAAGSSQWYSYNWIIPKNQNAGQYSYFARVYSGQSKLSPQSTSQTFTVRKAAGSAAEIVSLWPVNDAKVGATIKLWAQIKNAGSQYLPSNARVWFWMSGLTSPYIGSTLVGAITSGSTTWFSFSWPIPSRLAPGNYTYWARVFTDNAPLSEWSTAQAFTVSAQSGIQSSNDEP